MKNWRRAFARAASTAFRIQRVLVCLCFLCFALAALGKLLAKVAEPS